MTQRKIAVVDTETDPFIYGQVPQPFVVGFYDGTRYLTFWGDDCREKFIEFLRSESEPFLIYAHNGGKFDFFFFVEFLEDHLHIQNGRIVKCFIGQHELRDSYSIIPVALDKFEGVNKKQALTENDYLLKFRRESREAYRHFILDYLRADCLALYDGVNAFRVEFGDKLTIGSTAMKELKKFHQFEVGGSNYDSDFRQYYFGGRNQCFASGIIKGDYKIFDVNSMYPFVMRDFQHPVSTSYNVNVKLTPRTTFARIIADSDGCLPIRTKTGLDFTQKSGEFFACIHEINAGLETGTLRIQRIKHTIEHTTTKTFAEFVDHFYEKRLQAKARRLGMLEIFYKTILNSSYGKFAQNPMHYKDYQITDGSPPQDACQLPCAFYIKQETCPYHWTIHAMNAGYTIWSKPSASKSFFNVATAASITSAARAVLLRGLAAAVDPLYCDTDSIIARQLHVEIDSKKLGAWKIEATGSELAIAGKKLYAVVQGDKSVKHASKGARISGAEVFAIARGENLSVTNPVPHFKIDGKHGFTRRTLKATGSAADAPGVRKRGREKPAQRPAQ